MAKGWVKLHRCVLESAAWLQSTNDQRVVMMVCLTKANHSDRDWMWGSKRIVIHAGQFVTSSEKLAAECNVSRQTIRSALSRLKNVGFLTYESTKHGTLVTVVNWGKYQADDPQTNQQSNQPPIQQGNQQPIQPISHKQEDKKIRSKNVNTTKAFVKPTAEEVRAYCTERNNGIDADTFIDFYESRGWMVGRNHMKDWKATVRNWEHRRKEERGDDGPASRPEDEFEQYQREHARYVNRNRDKSRASGVQWGAGLSGVPPQGAGGAQARDPTGGD